MRESAGHPEDAAGRRAAATRAGDSALGRPSESAARSGFPSGLVIGRPVL